MPGELAMEVALFGVLLVHIAVHGEALESEVAGAVIPLGQVL